MLLRQLVAFDEQAGLLYLPAKLPLLAGQIAERLRQSSIFNVSCLYRDRINKASEAQMHIASQLGLLGRGPG